MWIVFVMITVASLFALGFVLGRVWEIRLQMRLQDMKSGGPELTEHLIARRLRLSIEQTLISLGWAKTPSAG
jgi:hypothetical protein